jgi:uncharacterized protein YggE
MVKSSFKKEKMMKRIISAVSILLLSNNIIFAMEPQQLNKTKCSPASCGMESQQFSVTGYGKVPYAVDLVDIQLSVSVRDSDAESSKKKHDKIMVKVNKYLKEKGYPDGILSLQSSTLLRQTSSTGKREDDFYLARSEYLMRTDHVQETNSLQIELVEIGVDEIQSVTLLSSKQRQLEDEARKLALKDALEKADLTAKTLGLKLGKPANIRYETPSGVSGNSVEMAVKVIFSFQAETNTQEIVPADAVKTQQ